MPPRSRPRSRPGKEKRVSRATKSTTGRRTKKRSRARSFKRRACARYRGFDHDQEIEDQITSLTTEFVAKKVDDKNSFLRVGFRHGLSLRTVSTNQKVRRYFKVSELPAHYLERYNESDELTKKFIQGVLLAGERVTFTEDDYECETGWEFQHFAMKEEEELITQGLEPVDPLYYIAQFLYSKGFLHEDFFADVCPMEHVSKSLEHLFTYCQKNIAVTYDTCARIATLYELCIKWIHPFIDGNARLARAFSLAFLEQHQFHNTFKRISNAKSIDEMLGAQQEIMMKEGITLENIAIVDANLPHLWFEKK